MDVSNNSVMNVKQSDFRTALQDSLFNEIASRNDCKLYYTNTFGTIWIKDEEPTTEFRYVIIANQLIVSRILFKNRRRGCMTACFEILKQFASKLNYDTIVIQSVETYEMMQWCTKMDFMPSSCNIMVSDHFGRDVLIGDYYYHL